MADDNDTTLGLPFEQRAERALREIVEASGLDVERARAGETSPVLEEPAEVFRTLAEDEGLPLSERVRGHFFRPGLIEAHWRSGRPGSRMAGEFSLTHILRAVVENHMDAIWEGEDDWERDLYGQLRFFDDTPGSGTGRMALLRAAPGAADPEVWFFDTRQGAMPMELDYPGYLDAVLVTKGVMGWQYLYCEPAYSGLGFASVSAGLEEMAQTFPVLFPHHDYTDLRTRLEERL
ncbi:hypothetical protein [Streptomyces sp. UH6]|uniref:hypothetical protein n=1 Tax=Streptomyces sp. UH6 TaxID=2748379 RepID=UPI0015D4C00A|nr:hypothetical protein [Streptomyces sp. UH6]NYV76288.1 hypothetical protein [Streptomyces sp. UH6]